MNPGEDGCFSMVSGNLVVIGWSFKLKGDKGLPRRWWRWWRWVITAVEAVAVAAPVIHRWEIGTLTYAVEVGLGGKGTWTQQF